MPTVEGFEFFPLQFDDDGKLKSTEELARLKQHANDQRVTDAVFIAHGFRNDENEARKLYSDFLRNFRAHSGRPEFQGSIGGRRFAMVGVFWPSKAFREGPDRDEGGAQGVGDDSATRAQVKLQLEELRNDARPGQRSKLDRAIAMFDTLDQNKAAQDEFVELVLSVLDGTELDADEGVEQIRAQSGSELLDKLKTPIILATEQDDEEGGATGLHGAGFAGAGDGGVESIGGFFKSVAGRVGQFLNMTTWYLMKDRSGKVGDRGTAEAVRALKASRPEIKVHLVGHSLGGRLMAACAKSLGSAPKLQPDSLTLLEAAFSHYGFSADNGHGKVGFFRDVVAQKIVRGPLVSTFSSKDTVVGKAYAIASRLAGDNVRVGGRKDPFGGIGRNGTQKTTESVSEALREPGRPYVYQANVVNNLDGSAGLITSHGDVTNPAVTYAFASAVAGT